MSEEQANADKEFLIVSMAYCMTWELVGSRASEHWAEVRSFVAGANSLAERQRWAVELYEESPPTAQEERSIRARINAYLRQPRDVAYFRTGILNLLPVPLQESAAAHSLMHGLEMPSTEYSNLKSWVMRWKSANYKAPIIRSVALAEREVEFNRFLEQPSFAESFRCFWGTAPKCRDNRRTRVLVSLAAALSQMLQDQEAADFDLWTSRFSVECHFTAQTKQDLRVLLDALSANSYDVEELAYHLLVDANEADHKNVRSFIDRYSDQLSSLAAKFALSMQFRAS